MDREGVGVPRRARLSPESHVIAEIGGKEKPYRGSTRMIADREKANPYHRGTETRRTAKAPPSGDHAFSLKMISVPSGWWRWLCRRRLVGGGLPRRGLA